MKNEEKQTCDNCICKTVCYERANIADIKGYESKAMKSWEEYVKQYGCQYYQPKLPENRVVLTKEEYKRLKSLPIKIIKYMDRHLGNGELCGNVVRNCAKQFDIEIKE